MRSMKEVIFGLAVVVVGTENGVSCKLDFAPM